MSHSTSVAASYFQHWHRRPGAQLRLFCFPYAGGGASVYRSWSQHLPQEIEICPIQLPGRENRFLEQPVAQVTTLVEMLVPVLLPYLNMPYALFGHSMGGLISFELARSLQQRTDVGAPVSLLVSGKGAPHLPQKKELVSSLPDAEFVEKLRDLNGTPEEILHNEEFLHLMLPLLRADFAACEAYQYQPGPALSFPLVAYGGLLDPVVSKAEIIAWKQHTSSTFRYRFFHGDHFFLHSQQSVLLDALARDLLQKPAEILP